MTPRDAPVADRLYTIGEGGRRNFLHPAQAKGRHTTRRWAVGITLIAWLFALPFVQVNGHPAILLAVTRRRFHVFGATFAPTDSILLFFLLTAIGFALVVGSALWGRIWCGYACPQTVFLEQIYRPVERLFEGSRDQQLRLDKSPWTVRKLAVKGGKHATYVAVSFILAHLFLLYFVGVKELGSLMLSGPRSEPTIFVWAMAVTGFMYFNFAWFREQMCIIICPYGRLQSALSDKDTVVIGYDNTRQKDCVDCYRCVAVCPTGIDIRHGMQLECVGCAACIDACDDVMTKLHRERGLVRYDSQRGFETKARKFWRPRVGLYGVLALLGLTALTITLVLRRPMAVTLVRQAGPPYVLDGDRVRNAFAIAAHNQRDVAQSFTVTTLLPDGAQVLGGIDALTVLPGEDVRRPVFLDAPRSIGPFDFSIVLRTPDGEETALRGRFTAPAAQ